MKAATPAVTRYLKRFFPTMIAYMVALFGARYAIEMYDPKGVALVVLAVLPALPMVGVIAVIGLYIIEERDEFLRQRAVTGMLVGVAVMLALASIWGFLEEEEVVPHLPAYWAFVIWCAGWGMAQITMALRDRIAGVSA